MYRVVLVVMFVASSISIISLGTKGLLCFSILFSFLKFCLSTMGSDDGRYLKTSTNLSASAIIRLSP